MATLRQLQAALNSTDADGFSHLLLLPAAIQNRTPSEQIEFLRKTLRDEILAEGMALLQAEGRFGAASELFPQEATNWARQAGVSVEQCVAFRLDRTNAPRLEVVLVKPQGSASTFRVARLNNVTQPFSSTNP